MQVLYTHDIFTKQVFGGISRYVTELSRHLPQEIEPTIFAGLHINKYVHPQESIGLRMPSLRFCSPLRENISRVSQHLYTISNPPDIFHRSYYGAPFYHGKKPIVLTVYDMIHERYPGMYADDGRLSAAKYSDCVKADHIIAISESTKSDLIELFSIDPQKITRIYLASSELNANAELRRALTLSKPYILFVGQRGGYKNFNSLLIAYSRSLKARTDFDLICFGGGVPRSDEKKHIADLGLIENIRFSSGNDDDLRAHLEAARMLVYPSCYEGFGLPVLEAMQAACPVLCADNSSLPEVAGDAAAYIHENLADQLESLIYSNHDLEQMVLRGKLQAKKFSWSNCASETTDIYRALC